MCSDETDRDTFIVVLTGGIASGKSTVSNLFQELGVPVIDTDLIALELVQPGQKALKRIIACFGTRFLLPDGNLDRQQMRSEVFSNKDSRAELEAILHPMIMKTAHDRILQLDTPYCILVVPLYTESQQSMHADRILVVDVEEEVQLSRLMQRDSVNIDLARLILESQASRSERLDLADDVILNDKKLNLLKQDVSRLHKQYLKLAALNN
jgi:dephospho-CoA kinase